MRGLSSVIERFPSAYALSRASINHCQAIKVGSLADIYAANNILNSYARCQTSGLGVAYKLFDEMPHRDSVTWNTMITGYVNSGNLEAAWDVQISKGRCGLYPDLYTFGSLLKGVAFAGRIESGQQLHCQIVKLGFDDSVYAGSALLDMYAKCERVDDALKVFEEMPQRNSVSWNALISGFVKVGDRDSAFWLFGCMEREGVSPDDGSLSPLLTLLDNEKFYSSTMQLHCKSIKHGVEFENTVFNATITAYSECGSLDCAKRLFDSAVVAQDLVTWNSMLAGYLAHNRVDDVFELFVEMREVGFEPDIYTYTSILSACSGETIHLGKSLHGLIITKGLLHYVPICNALMAMYISCNDKKVMGDAMDVFQSMEFKDRVSWNSILTGFSQSSLSEDALKFFKHMRSSLVETDHYSFSAALRSCSDLATLQLGKQIHVLTVKSGLESNDFVASALIFMYSKCGMLEEARKSFNETEKGNAITWNSIIFAYAQHGQGNVALDLFSEMRETRVKLDHITFVAVLTACSHIGLVEQGRKFLKSMASEYGIPLRMEHYACAVDLFGRAGYLNEAKDLIESMPYKPDAMVLKTLLAACRACGNVELATQVASHLLELEPEEHCSYVILSNMYARLQRWDEKAGLTRLMKERKVKKVPGWSWIEVNNVVHSFIADDRSSPCFEEIYRRLDELMEEMKWLESTRTLGPPIDALDLYAESQAV
ncbi:Putative pentatricopeptide repeat-containing protein At3g25970 [Linum perenne]